MSGLRKYEVFAKTRAFQRKLDGARRIVNDAAERGRVVVAMSWGKDSCAMGNIACEELGRIDMMHMACAHELPGGDAVKGHFAELGAIHELPPINTLAESLDWLETVGLPHERPRALHQKIIRERKKRRGDTWAIEHGYAVTMLGMRAEEARGRRWCFRLRTPTYRHAETGHWISNPLAWWTVKDVWAYLVSRGIPWHPLYDKETLGFTRETLRNGGWLYTDGIGDGWAAWLRMHYPEQWRMLTDAFPRVRAQS